MASTFTCISCRVAFRDADLQRLHYKTDWHHYNLKRKIADLLPVTAEDFQRRILQQREQIEAEAQEVSLFCAPCRKTFSSQNAFDNHLPSKKHRDALLAQGPSASGAAGDQPIPGRTRTRSEDSKEKVAVDATMSEEDSDTEIVDSDEWEAEGEGIPTTDCLFCSHHSANIAKNLKHMSSEHSFFIPDVEFVADMEGFLAYLGEKVGQGFLCLWCSEHGKAFWSMEATQQHMRDKGHCKIKHEGAVALAEFADYYDFTSSYPDDEEGDPDMEIDDIPELDGSDYQLTLPSGATIGHRSLMRYYRQNLDPSRSLVLRNDMKGTQYVAQYRAIGYTESTKEAIQRKKKDLRFMRRVQSKMYMKVGMKANKFQPHFRQQVNF